MTGSIKRGVDMNIPRRTKNHLPDIPFDQLFFRDAYDIEATEEEIDRMAAAARQRYRRWQQKQNTQPGNKEHKEFYVGKVKTEEGLIVRVYCHVGPIDESHKRPQPTPSGSQGSEPQ